MPVQHFLVAGTSRGHRPISQAAKSPRPKAGILHSTCAGPSRYAHRAPHARVNRACCAREAQRIARGVWFTTFVCVFLVSASGVLVKCSPTHVTAWAQLTYQGFAHARPLRSSGPLVRQLLVAVRLLIAATHHQRSTRHEDGRKTRWPWAISKLPCNNSRRLYLSPTHMQGFAPEP